MEEITNYDFPFTIILFGNDDMNDRFRNFYYLF